MARVASPVTRVEALFRRPEAQRLVPGAAVMVVLASGEYIEGEVERVDEESPASSPPSRTIKIPRDADQVRAMISLETRLPTHLKAAIPATVAITRAPAARYLLYDRFVQLAIVAAVALAVLLLATKAVFARLPE